ncbi:MAG: dihydropteroate synthase [Actinomycetota bacterium]|nr:dihydropteroate synthase [Actinomycetota bacterium]
MTLRHPVHRFGARSLDFSHRIAVMAVVNRTPDSFYDGGHTLALDDAVAAALTAADAGADWVDVGGQPFAPGARLRPDEEAERVVPVIQAVRSRSDVVLSVDTFEPEVAAAAIAAGADVINDTSGLRDPELAAVVADSDAHVIITHSLAAPRQPYPQPRYADVVTEVRAFLEHQAEAAVAAGVPEERILVDPGHDLNKNTLHSLELTQRFSEIAQLGFPTVAAVSNKDFIGETLRQDKENRLAGSLAAAVICALGGARILRMHNVEAAVSAVRLTEAVLGWRPPAELRHNMESAEPAAPVRS